MLKRVGRSPVVQRLLGTALAAYLKLVYRTSSVRLDPPDRFERIDAEMPAIVATWHGQHFAVPLHRPPGHAFRVMVSRSGDGEINAVAARRLGLGLIRASGAHHAHQVAKRGGMRGFIEALRCLREGDSIAMTADVPKVSRVAGLGVVQLARHSGRPILPVAVATSRHIDLPSWDRATINLPVGRMAVVVGDPIRVSANAGEDELEAARRAVEAGVNAAPERAYALAKSG
ncbi:lysophospholipid acyltransferase family protein [Stappia sp.]|uniref:lysophospholipid acyltransferase family protein n=1 Tax=Stappia sp. TaxID=1870903 RepID=UPI003A98D65C